MFRRHKTLLLRSTTLAVALAICLVAHLATRSQPADAPPWYSIVPPLLAVSLALLTNRLFLSLAAAVVAGGLLSVIGESPGLLSGLALGVGQGGRFVARTLYDIDDFQLGLDRFNVGNLQILLFVALLMPAISVMLTSGGLQGVANWLLRFARSVRSTRLVAMASGLVIFIDDYANTMIVGPTLRPMTDRN
ncbi:MAG: hypothetical protein HQ582_13150, partial [Planctomycetes bacterium]|nr:hypothetical protein [Planctomycetota bacterium]